MAGLFNRIKTMKNLTSNENVKFSTTAIVVLTSVCVLISVFTIIGTVYAGNFEVSVVETGGRRTCADMPPYSNTGSNYFTYTVSVKNNTNEEYRIVTAAFHDDHAGCSPVVTGAGGGWSIVSGKQNYLPGETGITVMQYRVDRYSCGRIQYDASYRPRSAPMSESTLFIATVVNYGKDCDVSCSLNANPNLGTAPLNNVDFTTTIKGTGTGNAYYKLDCNNDGTYEYNYSGNTSTWTKIDACNYQTAGTYTAKARIERDGVGATCTDTVTVSNPPTPTVSCAVSASPNLGTAPLNDVDLTSSVGGSATGSIVYQFDCTNNGTWEHTTSAISSNPYTASNLCDYTSAGTYTVKARVTRQGVSATCTDTVTVVEEDEPTCSIYANPETITQGNYSNLNWSSSNATSCYASNAWSGNKSLSGNQSVSPSSTSTYTLTCYNSNSGHSDTCSTTVAVNDILQPSCSIYASPSSITSGNSSNLTWSANNASYCYASNAWSGNKSISGSQSVWPTYDSTYTLVCYNSNGYSATCSTNVDVNDYSQPSCSIYASPSSITQGNYSNLNWSSSNATSCYASNAWSGNKSLSGNQSVSPSSTSTYTLTCYNSNSGHSDTCSTTVAVNDILQPSCSIYASPSSITSGNSSNLTWSANNASYCYASNAWSGNKSISGSQSVWPTYDSTYTLVCYNSNGYSATCSTNVDVNDYSQPSCSIYASPSSITQGNYSNLNWSSSNATSCYASNAWSGNKSLSGNQSVSPSSTSTYTLTCQNSNSGYSGTCSATIYVETVYNNPNLSIEKLVRNVTNSNPSFYNSVSANPGDEIEFLIRVASIGTSSAYNVKVKDILPSDMTYVSGSTTIDGVYASDGIISNWISIGNIPQGSSKDIKFRARVSSSVAGVYSGAAIINVASQNIQTSSAVSLTNLGRNITRITTQSNSFQAYYGDEAEFLLR